MSLSVFACLSVCLFVWLLFGGILYIFWSISHTYIITCLHTYLFLSLFVLAVNLFIQC